jgi:hypothetical protein
MSAESRRWLASRASCTNTEWGGGGGGGLSQCRARLHRCRLPTWLSFRAADARPGRLSSVGLVASLGHSACACTPTGRNTNCMSKRGRDAVTLQVEGRDARAGSAVSSPRQISRRQWGHEVALDLDPSFPAPNTDSSVRSGRFGTVRDVIRGLCRRLSQHGRVPVSV